MKVIPNSILSVKSSSSIKNTDKGLANAYLIY